VPHYGISFHNSNAGMVKFTIKPKVYKPPKRREHIYPKPINGMFEWIKGPKIVKNNN